MCLIVRHHLNMQRWEVCPEKIFLSCHLASVEEARRIYGNCFHVDFGCRLGYSPKNKLKLLLRSCWIQSGTTINIQDKINFRINVHTWRSKMTER